MRIQQKNISATKVSIVTIADESDIQPIYDHVVMELGQKTKIPGFRAGKAPKQLLVSQIDPTKLQNEFFEHTVQSFYSRSLKSQNIRPAGEPDVKILKFVPYSQIEIEYLIDVLPEIILANYKKLGIKKPTVEVKADEIKSVLKSLQERFAVRQEILTASDLGNEIVLDIQTFRAGDQVLDALSGKDKRLVLGRQQFAPDFDDNLVGLKKDQSKSFNYVYPKDGPYSALVGQTLKIDIYVKSIFRLNLALVDDKLATQVADFKYIAELRSDIKKQLINEKNISANQQYQTELIEAISKKSKLEIPQKLLDSQIDRLLNQWQQNLVFQGITYPEYLNSVNLTAEKHRSDIIQPQAESQLRAGLILAEIAQLEKILVSADELASQISILKEHYRDPAMKAELDKPANQREIHDRLMTEKTIAKIVSLQ